MTLSFFVEDEQSPLWLAFISGEQPSSGVNKLILKSFKHRLVPPLNNNPKVLPFKAAQKTTTPQPPCSADAVVQSAWKRLRAPPTYHRAPPLVCFIPLSTKQAVEEEEMTLSPNFSLSWVNTEFKKLCEGI
ncbi:hypothetical protein PIB30_073907 [Stylosanthes scabra]|uniref:Uncharacterized protein n=1 Tax=Stylosanthes scabra TaxID=79078 RepID=A0ABU6TQ08_9FABA|nr:hypothetical protein [Stylosanthes scabra]